MHVQSLTLTNVRQFDQRSFEFKPGFNLLVGENGAGKTTLLRSLWTLLAKPKQKRELPLLGDDDIRVQTPALYAEACLVASDGAIIANPTFRRRRGSRAARRGQKEVSPLILWYGSKEASCSNFVVRHTRVASQTSRPGLADQEAWLYEESYQRPLSNPEGQRFGRSQDIQPFVSRMLSTFSSNFRSFRWSFEPYDCSLNFPDGESPFREDGARAKRSFERELLQRLQLLEKPIQWEDTASVILDSEGADIADEKRNPLIPRFAAILRELASHYRLRLRTEGWTIEMRLSPRIRILDNTGNTFLLAQLSDGEQRLFSLFVDIARQLSLEASSQAELLHNIPALVLIDEIDVHLHPKWQRMVGARC